MEPNAILLADPLDILFENRNKSYGAYPLRKYYAQRLYISLGVTISLVTILVFLYLHFQTLPLTVTEIDIPVIINGLPDIPVKLKPVLPVARPSVPKPPATIEFATPVITVDKMVPKPMATVEEINKSAIGLTMTAGEKDNGAPQNTGNSNAGTAVKIIDSMEGKPEVFDRVERMPEFPGGPEGLKRFLLKNLRMPENDLETQVRVVARFVVGSDGRVRDIEMTQAGGADFNAEVKRVIAKMPDWKPGMQNHRPVAVYFSLPVNFVNAE